MTYHAGRVCVICMVGALLTPILYIFGCRKIHGVARGKGFAHVQMVCSIALDQVYHTYSACGKAYGATQKRHYQFSHFDDACPEEVRRCPYASMWGSKLGRLFASGPKQLCFEPYVETMGERSYILL